MTSSRSLLAVLLLLGPTLASAAESPSYARDVRPLLAKYCLECHNAEKMRGDLDLESYKALREGGKHGAAFQPGKPDASLLVLLVEKKKKPPMPPEKATQPRPEEIALLRAWVAAGAKDDSAAVTVALPKITPRQPSAAPLTTLAYRPDGKLLAVGSHRTVFLIDVASGSVVGKLPGQTDAVTALAFSRDGQRLAVASGASGSSGEVRLYAVKDGQVAVTAERTWTAHADIIYGLAFHPDGQMLATCGYDRRITLWEVSSGKELRTLKDHSDTIYGLAFHPDGKLLASAAADRAVKVWDVASGKRLYTLGDATDWLYAVAWSPDGKHIAAGGIDRSIRVWEASADGGKLVHSVFAHEAPITRLVYTADGKTLYTLGEDRIVKTWDTAKMGELRVYPKQPEAVLALAVRPDQKQFALGRYDGALVLLDPATGQVQSQPLPAKPQAAQLNKLTPTAAQRGLTVRVTFEGKNLDDVKEILVSEAGATAKIGGESQTATSVQADVTFPALTRAGVYQLTLKGPGGQAGPTTFLLDAFAAVQEQEPNDSPSTGQKIMLPASIVGSLGRAGDVDCYRFEAKAGQQVGAQVVLTPGSKMEPVLMLYDPAGRVVAESGKGLLGFTCEKAGTYALAIRDQEYRGGALAYRLHVGDLPIITGVFPPGLQRGTEVEIALAGVHLGESRSIMVKAAADAQPGSRLPVEVKTPLGLALGGASVVVGEFAEKSRRQGDPGLLSIPGTGNGVIETADGSDTWRFSAKKGQRLVVEVNARRLSSQLDSVIEILDAKGQPVPRTVLRCLSKTYTTFRDHDSAGSGIRLETWNELAVHDYLLVGTELVRIKELPRGPDDDCQFWSVAGQRTGFLDTTPTHHSLGTPMYKVSFHPPGTTFPPNGLPLVTLYYRNDDGGPGYGKDSRLFFDPPADGDYQVRISDARGQGSAGHFYRLTVRPPRPSFEVRFNPTAPNVWKGGAVPVTVTADRSDGYDGPIALRLENLPAGFSAPETTVPAGETTTAFALSASADAAKPAGMPLKLVARARIDGKEVVREAIGAVPQVQEPGDIVTTVEASSYEVRPGKEVRVTVTIERRNGFAGRVPLEVRGLPHGVRVLDVGLNGILVTEKDTSRTFVIYCEPWMEATEHPFVVLARREGKNTEHAAKSVSLRVVK